MAWWDWQWDCSMALKSLALSPDLRRAWTSGHQDIEIDEDVNSCILFIGSHEVHILKTARTRLLPDYDGGAVGERGEMAYGPV